MYTITNYATTTLQCIRSSTEPVLFRWPLQTNAFKMKPFKALILLPVSNGELQLEHNHTFFVLIIFIIFFTSSHALIIKYFLTLLMHTFSSRHIIGTHSELFNKNTVMHDCPYFVSIYKPTHHHYNKLIQVKSNKFDQMHVYYMFTFLPL